MRVGLSYNCSKYKRVMYVSMLRRREIPILLVSVSGIIATLDYFIKAPEVGLRPFMTSILDTVAVIVAFLLIYSATFAAMQGARRVIRRQPEWYLGGWRVFCFLIMFAVGVIPPILQSEQYTWLYTNVQLPITSTMFAYLGFFILSAAFRAFRARTTETAVLLICGIFAILGNTPMAASLWDGFPELAAWLRAYPTGAGMRGLIIGAGIGAVILGIRVLLGREKEIIGVE